MKKWKLHAIMDCAVLQRRSNLKSIPNQIIMQMNHILIATSIALSTIGAYALEPVASDSITANSKSELFRLDVNARVDWQYHRPYDHIDNSETGFEGKYLMFRMDGKIIDGLTYSWRQRLNKIGRDRTAFDCTDWIYLNYATGKWNFQAGKEIVAIGGWEYDRAPFDLYGCSVFWQNINCYELGVSAGYSITERDHLTAQITQSPSYTDSNRNMYAYNLMWNGSHGIYSAIWSANMIEAYKGRFVNYLALGNKLQYSGWELELDLMNRASSGQTFFFKDFSTMAELAWNPANAWRVHAKMTYDVNKTRHNNDVTVLPGTELTMAGGGVEYYPLKKDRTSLRLHAALYYSWGKNSNTSDLMQSRTLFASLGVTWNMNLLKINR